MNRSRFAGSRQTHTLAIDGQHGLALGADNGRLRLSSSPPAGDHRFPLSIRRGQRELAGQAGLQTVGESEPMLAPGGGEAAEGTEYLLPRTIGGAYGFDEKIIVVGFALVRLGGPANVHRTLYITDYRLII